MNPSMASAGVAKLAMPLGGKELRASRLTSSPSQHASTGLAARRASVRRCSTVTTSCATAVLEASAVGQFMTRMASAPSSRSSTSRARE